MTLADTRWPSHRVDPSWHLDDYLSGTQLDDVLEGFDQWPDPWQAEPGSLGVTLPALTGKARRAAMIEILGEEGHEPCEEPRSMLLPAPMPHPVEQYTPSFQTVRITHGVTCGTCGDGMEFQYDAVADRHGRIDEARYGNLVAAFVAHRGWRQDGSAHRCPNHAGHP